MYQNIKAELIADLHHAIAAVGLTPPATLDLKYLSGALSGTWGYASSVSFQLGKGAKLNPVAVAELVAAQLPAREGIDHVETVKGYINFYLDSNWFANQVVNTVLRDGANYGQAAPVGLRVMIEFSQPNTHKAFHVGHLRNACLGSTVVNVLRKAGYEVIGANYIGDSGAHVIKCLWCYLRFHNGQEPESGKGIWLNRVYSEGNARLEYRNEVLSQVRDWVQEDAAATATATAYLGNSPSPDAAYLGAALLSKDGPDYKAFSDHELIQDLFDRLSADRPSSLTANRDWWAQVPGWVAEQRALWQRWEGQDPELLQLWRATRDWSMEEFYHIYEQLNIKFDAWFFESEVEEEGKLLVAELVRRGLAHDERPVGPVYVKLDDAIRADPELSQKYAKQLAGSNPDGSAKEVWRTLVLLRKDGSSLYGSKDLALARLKLTDYHADRLVYVVDVRQSLYMQQVYKLLELLRLGDEDKFQHLSYEMVTLPGGAMSSRKGNAIFYEELASGAVEKALAVVNEKNPDLSDELKQEIATQVAFGAIRFEMLSKDNNRVLVFDWERALNFEGQSAPYIQYQHARACSVLRKAEREGLAAPQAGGSFQFTDLTKEETALLELIARYPDELQRAAEQYRPINMTSYLFELADAFSTFYDKCPILKSAPQLQAARLALTQATRQTIANALADVGVAAPKQMLAAYRSAKRDVIRKGHVPPYSGRQMGYLGRITLSITWITPLSHTISVCTTLALSTFTPPELTSMVTSLPSTVLAEWSLTTSAAITLPATTW